MTESVQKQAAPTQAVQDSNEENVLKSVLNGDSTEGLLIEATPSNRSMQRAIAMVVGLVLLLCISLWSMYALRPADPYVQSVLQLVGDQHRGKEIFVMNCATCHGLEASGEVGPDLRNVSERKSSVALIQQVISGQTPPMPQFQPNERDMADLLAFLKTL
ncbi:MAG: cytochrome c [Cyanobacteria bacterium J06554_3]